MKKNAWSVVGAIVGAAAAAGAAVIAARYVKVDRFDGGVSISFDSDDLKQDVQNLTEAAKERFAPVPEGTGAPIDLDGDGVADAIVLDVDGDGIVDAIAVDEDGDGIAEASYIDTDGDGEFETVVVNEPDESQEV